MDYIDINLKKPKIGQRCLIYNKIGDWYELGIYEHPFFYSVCEGSKGIRYKATHWIPCPDFVD